MMIIIEQARCNPDVELYLEIISVQASMMMQDMWVIWGQITDWTVSWTPCALYTPKHSYFTHPPYMLQAQCLQTANQKLEHRQIHRHKP